MILLFIFFIMFMIPLVGMTITLNRAEHLRTRMQGTMDRAVLAAADIDQTLQPRDVVLDYFAKSGLSDFINANDINVYPDTVDALRTGRRVSLCGRGYINTNITDFKAGTDADGDPYVSFGRDFDQFGFTTCAAAEEAKSDIEVILVLDVSGSMRSNNKLENLQAAAKEFVDTVLSGEDAEGEISIGIVPYAGQVNAAPLLPYFTVAGGSSLLNCIDFTSAQFSQTAISPTTVLARSDYFDAWNSGQTPFPPRNPPTESSMPYCPNIATREIMPPTDDAVALKNRIDVFQAAGYTSLEIGMKWGTTMIDPSFRPAMQGLAAAGRIPAKFSNRPFDYGARSTAKYIVLMSDGQNTDGNNGAVLNPPYNSGLSPFYVNASGQLTVYRDRSSTSSDYCRYDGSGGSSSDCSWTTTPYSGSTQLTWPQLWERYTIRWISSNPNRAATGSGLSNVSGSVDPATIKDPRTSAICSTVKNAGATVFTIGFEAPQAGLDALLDCATSPGHFFDVDGVEISEAFQTIARKISELRLTN